VCDHLLLCSKQSRFGKDVERDEQKKPFFVGYDRLGGIRLKEQAKRCIISPSSIQDFRIRRRKRKNG
jgi:hypothetical protein